MYLYHISEYLIQIFNVYSKNCLFRMKLHSFFNKADIFYIFSQFIREFQISSLADRDAKFYVIVNFVFKFRSTLLHNNMESSPLNMSTSNSLTKLIRKIFMNLLVSKGHELQEGAHNE